MLKRISASNYKSFKKLDVPLAPITLFVGPNNSGKSSIISLIRLLSQTADSNDPNVRLLLNGALGDFGTYKDLIHENETRRHLEITLTIDRNEKLSMPPGADDKNISFNLQYKYRSSLKEIILKKLECTGNGKHHLTAEFNEESERFLVKKIGNLDIAPSSPASKLFRGFDVRNYLPRFYPGAVASMNESVSKAIFEAIRTSSRNAYVANDLLQSMEYVGAMRIPPSRTYLYTGERRQKVGANGEHAITMLAMDSMRKGSKSKGIRSGVVRWLNLAGIASDIKIVPLSDRYFEVHVQHPITKEYENFADVGYGNSQVIPILVAGLNTQSGYPFIAEEPEIHLHPKAQAELGDFFLELSNRGVQSIIETHSEHMILRLQTHIAAGRLKAEDLSIYYINPTPHGKEIIKLSLDERGVFQNDWPGGFFPERLAEARSLAIARAADKELTKKPAKQ
jgi:predicted ATPase